MVPGPDAPSRMVAVDFETTGFRHWDKSRVVEVGAVEFDGTEIVDAWSALIADAIAPTGDALEVNGIDMEMMAEFGIPGVDVFDRLAEYTDKAVVVAHRLPFEQRFWSMECDRRGLARPIRAGLCSKAVGWATKPHHVSTLASMAERRGADLGALEARLRDVADLAAPDRATGAEHSALFDAAMSGWVAADAAETAGGWHEAWQVCVAWAEWSAGSFGLNGLTKSQREAARYRKHFSGATVDE